MSTTIANITITRATAATQPFTITGLGDISGASVTLTVRDVSGASLFTRRNADAGGGASECVITNGATGAIEVYFVASNTSGMVARYPKALTHYYVLGITLASGLPYAPVKGAFIVEGD